MAGFICESVYMQALNVSLVVTVQLFSSNWEGVWEADKIMLYHGWCHCNLCLLIYGLWNSNWSSDNFLTVWWQACSMICLSSNRAGGCFFSSATFTNNCFYWIQFKLMWGYEAVKTSHVKIMCVCVCVHLLKLLVIMAHSCFWDLSIFESW